MKHLDGDKIKGITLWILGICFFILLGIDMFSKYNLKILIGLVEVTWFFILFVFNGDKK